jgi:hypothetical protein
MGNTTSSQRSEFLQRDDRRFQEIVQERSIRAGPQGSEAEEYQGSTNTENLRADSSATGRNRNSIYGIFRRQPLYQNPSEQGVTGQVVASEDVGDEQEERPLMTTEDAAMSDVPVRDFSRRTRSYDAPQLSRQPSTMSRLGSRLLPDSVARGLLNSGEETPAEGRALRLGNSIPERVRPTVFERRLPRQNTNRFSFRESLRAGSFTRAGSRRRQMRGSFPLPHMTSHHISQDAAEQSPSTTAGASTDGTSDRSSTWRRRARLSRVRDSLSLPSIFGSSSERAQPGQQTRLSPGRPAAPYADDSDHLLPQHPHPDGRLDMDDAPHELDAIEPEARNVLSLTRGPQATGTARRFPHALRSRSTRLIRRGEHPPLSQVLQLAAAAIAAQLSGHAHPSGPGSQSTNGEVFDGSIQNFVQTLQDVATAQAGEHLEGDLADGNLPPVNFLRVFQFPNTENSGSDRDQSGRTDSMDIDENAEDGDMDRSVTLVLVGVRSMPSPGDGSGDENGAIGPSLDTLLSLPFLPPTNILRNGSSGALFRRSDGRSRFSARRNSMTNFNSFPAQYESQRHQRTRSTTSRPQTDHSSLVPPMTSMPAMLSESPPGPHPPPSTPADPRSGAATPNRRPSSASAAHAPMLPNLSEDPSQPSDSADGASPFSIARQRRRSDSEFARRPELSSGASRRNGVVEPDNPPATTGRSWLIYVVGTNVSPDHPAFTMPSLFTDSPTYEDMQLLSTLLGPVKPPVATQEDLTSAGGVYRVLSRDGALVAESVGPSSTSPTEVFGIEDRCLICLCDYEASEEIRLLSKCQHIYHRECIDEVSHSSNFRIDSIRLTFGLVAHYWSELVPYVSLSRC